MKTLTEHNQKMQKGYGVKEAIWRQSGVLCPSSVHKGKDRPSVEMVEQVGVVHTHHPPSMKVRCPDCGYEDFKII